MKKLIFLLAIFLISFVYSLPAPPSVPSFSNESSSAGAVSNLSSLNNSSYRETQMVYATATLGVIFLFIILYLICRKYLSTKLSRKNNEN